MRFPAMLASLAFPIVLTACGGSSAPAAPSLPQGHAVAVVPQAQAIARAASTSYLYVVNNTNAVIDAYALPMSVSSVVAKTIPIVQPSGYAISGMAVDASGNVLYVTTQNYANYPPPKQPLYRCKAICKKIGTIPGGSGIAVSGTALYATAGISTGNGYDTSEILQYAYGPSSALGTPSTLYRDAGMDYTPVYPALAVNNGYLAASRNDNNPSLLVCTGLATTPACSAPTLSPSGKVNGAVALNRLHTVFLGLSYYGPNGFGEFCVPSGGVYATCRQMKIGNQGDTSSTAAIDGSGNFYDIALGNLYVLKNATTITLTYPITGLYGPIAVGK